jgi:hypothetical protein
METSMTIRSLATAASVIAFGLIGAVNPGMTGDLTAPFAVAAAQGTARHPTSSASTTGSIPRR